MEQELKMTVQEADKYALMKQIGSKKTSIKEASQIMGISYRQARRLWQRYQREGPTGLISKRRGKPSNNQIASDMKEKVLSLIKSKYADYGPTLVRALIKRALSL